jgi:hypothetical protein
MYWNGVDNLISEKLCQKYVTGNMPHPTNHVKYGPSPAKFPIEYWFALDVMTIMLEEL